MYLLITTTTNRSESFPTPTMINKSYNAFCTEKCLKGIVDGRLQCNCGEDSPTFDWCWEEENCSNAKFSKQNREILFHPVYSSGTAAVRGNMSFEYNLHYYWEIKMISKLYGTDVMVGVGTSRIDTSDWKFKFCSMLGIDSQSWGYSYHGDIQHNKLRRKYGTQFGLGSIIGVHLDMCCGTLEYFLNRKPLGIAFRGLKSHQLFPMVCSTSAQSAIRITCCISKKPTLQMLCLKYIVKHPSLYRQYRKIPGLTRIYDKQYFWIVPSEEPDEKKRLAELEDDVTLSLVNGNYLNRNKKFKPIRWMPIVYSDEEDGELEDKDIYDFESSGSNGETDSDGPSSSSQM